MLFYILFIDLNFQQDIQKRLSLPADIKLPQNVVEKLNRTPTLDNPLTRKSRRASLVSVVFFQNYKLIAPILLDLLTRFFSE